MCGGAGDRESAQESLPVRAAGEGGRRSLTDSGGVGQDPTRRALPGTLPKLTFGEGNARFMDAYSKKVRTSFPTKLGKVAGAA